MKISVFGLGYVGCVSAACLADMGHEVVGVDVNPDKLEQIRKGQSPIIEPGLDELLAAVVKNRRLTVTAGAVEAVRQTQISLICVGTPSQMNGNLETQFLDRVLEQIGAALRQKKAYHTVTIRSTLLPGVFGARVVPLLENASGLRPGEDFGLCINPEFLRESTAIDDFRNPPFTVIGEYSPRSGDDLAEIYEALPAPIYRVQPDAAAMVKYASNAFHALKVAFANEIGALCNELQIDSHGVMDIFAQDRQLNISPAYLRPGFAFGGSCLPKDVRALSYTATHRDISVPVLSAILPSNDAHIQRAVQVLQSHGKRRVALLGLSFKPGTDDLRESPMVRLAETLIGKGYRLAIFDEEVSLSNLFGRNREYIETVLPHIHELLQTDVTEIIRDAEVIIVGKKFKHLEKIRPLLHAGQLVLDLVREGNWQPAEKVTLV